MTAAGLASPAERFQASLVDALGHEQAIAVHRHAGLRRALTMIGRERREIGAGLRPVELAARKQCDRDDERGGRES